MPLHSPSPTTESGLVLVISALLPILSKLFLLMLLSGSSIFFGPSDLHPIYSPSPSQHFVLERVNDRYSRDDIAFQRAVRFPPANKSKRWWNMLLNKRRRILKRSLESMSNHEIPPTPNHRNNSLYTRTVLIVDVHTEDIHNTVEYLRDAVSFILHQYHSNDSRLDLGTDLEIVFNVESPGGAVQDYGLAANQIARLRDSGKESGDLTVTVCVDKIAASGGYMIACQASPGQLLAAPLAIVGSIGVFRETLNIYDILTKYGIQPLLIKAGKAKVPLTQMNEVTKEGLAFVQKNVDTTHEVFKKMVLDQRGDVIDKKHVAEVTSGDIYLGTNALALGLVDRLVTSDEYIAEKVRQGDRVLRLQKYDKSRAGMRFSPLDLLLSYKDGFLQSQLPWIRRFAPVLLSLLKLGLSAGVVKALDLV
jgi:signal peptide peptidase SppA